MSNTNIVLLFKHYLDKEHFMFTLKITNLRRILDFNNNYKKKEKEWVSERSYLNIFSEITHVKFQDIVHDAYGILMMMMRDDDDIEEELFYKYFFLVSRCCIYLVDAHTRSVELLMMKRPLIGVI